MITALTVVNKGSTSYISASFTDQNGDALAPNQVTYRVDDLKSGNNLVPAANVTPDASIEIRIPPAINSLVDPAAASEIRVATIEAAYGDGDALVEEVRWVVKDLPFKG